MLDQLADTDSAQGSVRHLTPEDLEAYTTGRLAAARLSSCQSHLDSCEACRAELEDLRTFKGDLASFARPEPGPREFGRRKRRGGLAVHLSAAAAVVCVVAGFTLVWVRHAGPRTNKVATAASAAPPAVALTAANVQTHDTRAATQTATHRNVGLAAPDTAQHGKLQPAPHSPGAPETNKGFALLGPIGGEPISEARPEFSWQPLPGAIHYSVAIVDARLHPVQRSPALRTTVWRPRRPLRPGRTYLWQVTATLRGGSKVVASAPGMLTESTNKL